MKVVKKVTHIAESW